VCVRVCVYVCMCPDTDKGAFEDVGRCVCVYACVCVRVCVRVCVYVP